MIESNPKQLMNINDAAENMANGIAKDASRRPKELMSLVEQTNEARAALLSAIQGIGQAVETFKPKSDEYVKELRAFTAGSVFELRNALNAFSDLRKFFLSADHASEIARLKEFVELAERLKALKDCGFLDKVADTMLRLDDADVQKAEAGMVAMGFTPKPE